MSASKTVAVSETPVKGSFPDVPPVKYEGPAAKNPLAYRHYNPDERVEGKSMRDHPGSAADCSGLEKVS